MPKIIVVLGQTATGKSDFAVEIARAIKSEIISADSRQVYRGMNLGTGKITKKEMGGIPHYMLDIAHPKKVFSVSDFKKKADKEIRKIIERNHTPIICGGTGFYIDAVIHGIEFPTVKPNVALRKELSTLSEHALLKRLVKLDPHRSKNIDINNKVRLIRAIEIAQALGKVPEIKSSEQYKVLTIGLTLPDEILKERIQARLLARIKKGMLREIKKLHTEGISWKRMDALGLEYRYGALYLRGKLTKQEMIERLNIEIWHYAKRQKIWFKKDIQTLWVDPRKTGEKKKALKEVQKFINTK